jgi:hypothetical protein
LITQISLLKRGKDGGFGSAADLVGTVEDVNSVVSKPGFERRINIQRL